MAANKMKISKYLQFNLKTVQGKLSLFLVGLCLLMALAFTLSYRQVSIQEGRQAYMRQVLVPSISLIDQAHIVFKSQGSLSTADTLIQQLNTLAGKWQGETAVIYYGQFIDDLGSEDTSDVAKIISLNRTKEVIQNQLSATELEASTFKGNYSTYLIVYFLFLFVFGFSMASLVMTGLFRTIRHIKHDLTSIGLGNLPDNIAISQNEFRSITVSMKVLVSNLNELTKFSHEVGKGNFDSNIDAFEKEGKLGQSLSEMRDSLKKVSVEDKNRRWFNEGIAHFAEKLRSHNGNVAELCELVMLDIAKHIQAIQGALYVAETEGSQNWLQMRACYAHDRQKYLNQKLPAGNGLLGQVFLEQAPKYLTEIPENYESIATGLGSGMPKCIFLVPLVNNDTVEGILELATLHELAQHEQDFIMKLAESLGAAISGVRISEETNRLLEESQMAAEQMRAQEEEMRQNAEELEATQEEIHRQIEEGQKQQQIYISLLNSVDGLIHRKRLNADLNLEFLSDHSHNLIGVSAENALHEQPSLLTYIHPEDRKRVYEELKAQTSAGGKYSVEFRMLRPNGAYSQVLDSGKLSNSDGGEELILDGIITLKETQLA